MSGFAPRANSGIEPTSGFGPIGYNPFATRLVADLNGLSQYITIPAMAVLTGESINLKFIANNVATVKYFFRDTASFFVRGISGNWYFEGCTVVVDGIPVTSLVTPFPIDEAEHSVVITLIADRSITVIGARDDTLSESADFPIFDVLKGDGSVYNYPINDGWANNPVIKNTADPSGLTDGTAINFTEATWIEVPV